MFKNKKKILHDRKFVTKTEDELFNGQKTKTFRDSATFILVGGLDTKVRFRSKYKEGNLEDVLNSQNVYSLAP